MAEEEETSPPIPPGTVGLVTGVPINIQPSTELLGRGTYGKVFGYDTSQGKIAIKFSTNLDGGLDTAALTEMAMLASLRGHPNVVQLLDAFVTPEYMAIVLPRAGTSLDKYMSDAKKKNGIPIEDVKLITLQLARGIEFIQSKDILNGDYKPQNILIYDDPTCRLRAVISDFGIAQTNRCFGYRNWDTTVFTIWWRAPELLLGGIYEVAADSWALGIILIEMLTGKHPFDAMSEPEALALIFLRIGIPSETTWPGVTSLPEWKPALWESYIKTYGGGPKAGWKLTAEGFPVETRYARTVGATKARKALPADAVSLIESLVVANPARRATMAQVQQHPWLASAKQYLTVPCQQAPPIGSTDCDVALRGRAAQRAEKGTKLGMTIRDRATLYSWLIEVQKEFVIASEVFAFATYLLGQYNKVKKFTREDYQRFGCAALHIAASLIEKKSPTGDDYVRITDYSMSLNELAEAVRDILGVVGVDLHIATIYDLAVSHLRWYSDTTKTIGKQLALLSLSTEAPAEEDVEVVALTCILLATLVTKEEFKQKSLIVDQYDGDRIGDVLRTYVTSLAEVLVAAKPPLRKEIFHSLKRGQSNIVDVLKQIPLFLTMIPEEHLIESSSASTSVQAVADSLSKISIS